MLREKELFAAVYKLEHKFNPKIHQPGYDND